MKERVIGLERLCRQKSRLTIKEEDDISREKAFAFLEKLRETSFTWLTCLMKSYIVVDQVKDKISTDPKNSFLS